MRKFSICGLAATAMSVFAVHATAQESGWTPSGPVTVVVHTGPGGGGDAFARGIIGALDTDDALEANMVVLNRPGGGSTTAMNYLAERRGDPNTIGVFTSVWLTDGLVQQEATVTMDDLTPVARLVLEPALLVVNNDSPYETLGDFIEAAQAAPGTLTQSGGSVTARDAVMRNVLMSETGADWSFVSFPSGGERVSAILGGHVDIMQIEPSEAGELIRAGRLRAIAQVSEERIEGYPDVPTLAEAGFDVPIVPQARGIVGPPDMPAEAVAYYEDLFLKGSSSPSYVEYFDLNQLENAYLGSEELSSFLIEYEDLLVTILEGAGVELAR